MIEERIPLRIAPVIYSDSAELSVPMRTVRKFLANFQISSILAEDEKALKGTLAMIGFQVEQRIRELGYEPIEQPELKRKVFLDSMDEKYWDQRAMQCWFTIVRCVKKEGA